MALNKSLTHKPSPRYGAPAPLPSLVVAGDGVVVLLALERRVRVVRPVAEALEVEEELAAVRARLGRPLARPVQGRRRARARWR